MEPRSLRYILSRTATAIFLIIAVLYGLSFLKKKQRKDSIVADLKSLSSDSSFFRQFSAKDAEKALIKAVGLIAEANQMGMDPSLVIDRGLGIEEKYFLMDEDRKGIPIREQIIRTCLRANYENFRKFGYTPDFHTLQSMKEGKLPPVRTGPLTGSRPEVGTIIAPSLSPGLDRVLANLEIRPVKPPGTPMSDVEIATAKRLAFDLRTAGVIEKSAEQRIIDALTPKVEEDPLDLKK
jgi:hypothetical protein